MVKKFASIDFLRGLAIYLMVFVHTFMRWINRNEVVDNINSYLLITLVLMLGLIFIGAWAGFFLLVSASGNMISMYKGIERSEGKVGGVVLKQVIGGFLLLLCGVLVESALGYHAALGEWAMGWPSDGIPKWDYILWRGFHFETIHAIAWCIILNGVVQGILSIKGGWKKTKRNAIIYLVLAVIVFAATMFVWEGIRNLIPGYPFEGRLVYFSIDRIVDVDIQYGVIGEDPFWELVWKFFLLPLAGKHEPIFPFLGVSFIGSAIGLFLVKSQKDKEEGKPVSTKPLKWGMISGLILFILGLAGVAFFVIQRPSVIENIILPHHFDVIHMFVEGLESYGPEFRFIWLPWFLMVTGAQIGAMCLILRTVEFRGKSKKFAKKTLYFRRYGFVAFSIYAWQFVDILAVLALSLIALVPAFSAYPAATFGPYTVPQNLYNVYQIWLLLIVIFAIYEILIRLWEKAHFTLGYEWFIAKVGDLIIPSKRKGEKKREGFFKSSRLDPKEGIYNPEWIETIPYDKVKHKDLVDSKLSSKLSFVGIVIPPVAFISLGIALTSRKQEGVNKYNKRGLIVSIIALVIAVALFITFFFIPIGALGLF